MIHFNRVFPVSPSMYEAGAVGQDDKDVKRGRSPWTMATVDEVSMQRDFAQQLYDLPPGRRQLIFRIRRQIVEGSYETEQKLDHAVDRMVETVLRPGGEDEVAAR